MNTKLRMMQDIHQQPASLSQVLAYQYGGGSAVFRNVAAALRTHRRIIITGMGASLYGAMSLSHALQSAGVGCITVEAGELLHFCGEIARNAVVVVVSRSGETIEAVRLLPELRKVGATIIGVYNEPGTTLEKQADLPLYVNSGRDEAVAVQTYTGTAFAMLLLAGEVLGKSRQAEAEQVPAAVERMIRTEAQDIDQWEHFFHGISVVYVLGRGPSLASAMEGGLLMNETAKLASVSMPTSGFRHGPVEVADAQFRAFVFDSIPRTAPLEAALLQNLEALKARVRTVRAAPGYFAPVVEIIPLQFAAYAASLQRGFTPGQFRYISTVTASETSLKTA